MCGRVCGCRAWAHPRVCGENAHALGKSASGLGSSPRVRGKHRCAPAQCAHARLIPACAGKTAVGKVGLPRPGAHPRVCGENSRRSDACVLITGSSPRVRGKPARLTGLSPNTGLIPACAGKTSFSRWALMVVRAHPRVCGENASSTSIPTPMSGSSPRVRGKRTR